MSEKKVSKHDLYEKLWASRDFEINHLWQRSVFLATFIVALFTLYAATINGFFIASDDSTEITSQVSSISYSMNSNDSTYSSANGSYSLNSPGDDDSLFDRPLSQLLALDCICFFGFMFSVLWICMAKGSKYMYERHEDGISAAQDNSGFFSSDLQDEIEIEWYETLWASGTSGFIPRHGSLPLSDYDFRILNYNGAKYSSSKINIAIGYIFVFAWVILSIANGIIVLECKFFVNLPLLPLELVAGFWLSYKVLSDSPLRRRDFIQMIIRNNRAHRSENYYNPEDNQIAWIKRFFEEKSKDSQYSFIFTYLKSVLENYVDISDRWLERIVVQDFLNGSHNPESLTESIVRRMMSYEDARWLFEISLMHREEFPKAFRDRWENPMDHSEYINITDVIQIRFYDLVRKIENFDKVNSDKNKTKDNNIEVVHARLFADTDWKRIRAGKEYDLLNDTRGIYLIQKEINGLTIYGRLSLDISITDKTFYFSSGEPIDNSKINQMEVCFLVVDQNGNISQRIKKKLVRVPSTNQNQPESKSKQEPKQANSKKKKQVKQKTTSGRKSIYDGVYKHLAGFNGSPVTITFAKLAALSNHKNGKLPNSAYKYKKAWWDNNNKHSQAKYGWAKAGYSAYPDFTKHKVIFR